MYLQASPPGKKEAKVACHSVHPVTELSQPEPTLPDGKTLEACSMQEKMIFLARLHQYSAYLSQKIAEAMRATQAKDIKYDSHSESTKCCQSHDIGQAPFEAEAKEEDDTHTLYASCQHGKTLSLPGPSVFDSQELKSEFLQEQGKISAKERNDKVQLSTEIGKANRLEVEENKGKVVIREKVHSHAAVTEAADWSSTSDAWLCDVADEQSQESSYSEWLKDVITQPSQSPKAAPAPPPKMDAAKENLCHAAWDVLHATYTKLFYLESVVYHSTDDEFVKQVKGDVTQMSERLSEFIEKAEQEENN